MITDGDSNKRGVFVKLRVDFLKMYDLAWASEIDKSEENLNAKKEVERHVDIWNKMAEFMEYGLLIAPNLCRFVPIYFNRKFPNGKTTAETNEELFASISEYNALADQVLTEYTKRYNIDEWCPTINFNDAKECEARLLKEGRYNAVNIDYSLSVLGSMGAESVGMNLVAVTYSNSMYHKAIRGEGSNELEAICDACVEFMNNERKLIGANKKELAASNQSAE
ncbi:MAG: hypothetical protein ACP5N2_07380 [Candidatus Nanoarchaeia archaeon]